MTVVVLPVSKNETRAALLRLFLDEILSDFDRAVYLDSDISPLTDISPLLSMSPKAAPVIVGYDLTGPPTLENNFRLGMSDGAAYFNSGVAVYDLKAVRGERIFADALQFAQENRDRCRYVDQDSLNVVLNGRWQVLDWRWNALNDISGRLPKQPFIRHFAGNSPWSRSKVGVQSRFVGNGARTLTRALGPDGFKRKLSDIACAVLSGRQFLESSTGKVIDLSSVSQPGRCEGPLPAQPDEDAVLDRKRPPQRVSLRGLSCGLAGCDAESEGAAAAVDSVGCAEPANSC